MEDKVEGGSQIKDIEEKEQRKHDDWKAHTHEKHRDPSEVYREGELHGAVGKEIHDALLIDHKHEEGGSTLTPDEFEQHKQDDWHCKKLEKDRSKDAEYRATESHGVVGKEIHDALEKEKRTSPARKSHKKTEEQT